ncbi:MAG: hypothetical protein IH994_10220 [Proteobacteria bacterium]|nr:hypothetical protein [Pseudomonadota bacterium]
MRPRPKPLMVLCFVLLMAAIMAIQSPPSPGPSRALKDAAARMKAYFPENPPPKGWQVAAISTRAGAVWVDLRLPEPEAASLSRPPFQALKQALGRQCPPQDDIVWRVLSPTQDIEIRAMAGGERAILAVSCRALGR